MATRPPAWMADAVPVEQSRDNRPSWMAGAIPVDSAKEGGATSRRVIADDTNSERERQTRGFSGGTRAPDPAAEGQMPDSARFPEQFQTAVNAAARDGAIPRGRDGQWMTGPNGERLQWTGGQWVLFAGRTPAQNRGLGQQRDNVASSFENFRLEDAGERNAPAPRERDAAFGAVEQGESPVMRNTRAGITLDPDLQRGQEAALEGLDAERAQRFEEAGGGYGSRGFFNSMREGANDFKLLGSAFYEALGEGLGVEGLARGGRMYRERYEGVRERFNDYYGPSGSFLGIGSVSDALGWAQQTSGRMIPLMVPSVAAGILTGGTSTVGQMAGAFAVSAPLGIGEVQANMKEMNPDAEAGPLVFVGGTAIGALDAILPGQIGGRLVTAFGREAAEDIAIRTLLRETSSLTAAQAARGVGRDMLTEAVTESLQEAIGEVTASLAADQEINWENLPPQMIEAAAAGGLMGGGAGSVTTTLEYGAGQVRQADEQAAVERWADQSAVRAFQPYDSATTIDATGRLANRRPDDNRAPPPGIREQAAADALEVTPDDIASPLPTADIAAGRAATAEAMAGQAADGLLSAAGIPPVGSPVMIDYGNDELQPGTVRDVFEDETGRGVVVELEGGRVMREYLDTLADAGVTIRRTDPNASADEIDAALRAEAEAAVTPRPSSGAELLQRMAALPPEQQSNPAPAQAANPSGAQAEQAAPPSEGDSPAPVDDGGAIIRGIFGDRARITSTYRGPNHPLSRANPRSWHTQSHAAVDIAPIPGMTFEEARAEIEAQGYTLIEAINETGSGQSAHATGDHWHFVIGSGGTSVAGGGVAAVQAPEQASAVETYPDVEFAQANAGEVAQVEGGRREAGAEPGASQAGSPSNALATNENEAGAQQVARTGTVQVGNSQFPFDGDFAKASDAYLQAIEQTDVGASQTPNASIFDAEGNQIAYVAYNGRVFAGREQDWSPETEILYDPRDSEPARPEADVAAVADVAPPAEQAETSQVRFEDTSSGKGIAVIGLTEAQRETIRRDVPKAMGVTRKDGAVVYGSQHAAAIRAAIVGNAGKSSPSAQPASRDDWRRLSRQPITDRVDVNGVDKADIVAVVDANNQVNAASASAAKRDAFRLGAMFELGLVREEAITVPEREHKEAFNAGRKKAKAEYRKRQSVAAADRPGTAESEKKAAATGETELTPSKDGGNVDENANRAGPRQAIEARAPNTGAGDTPSPAVTPTGREVQTRYRVVEMASLIPSNTADGKVNPDYPQSRQPRDRSRATSQTQIREMASNLNPRLLGRSEKAGDGAPIIAPDGIVESGNGRTLALALAYQEGGEAAQKYRRFIEGEGFDLTGMKEPVLVRIRDEMSDADVQAFVREANARDTAGMSGTETATSDAAFMPDGVIGLYRGGDVDAAPNRDFVRAFVNALIPAAERAGLVLKDGTIAAPLIKRIEAAMLVRALGPRPFIEKLVDAPTSNIVAIGKALVDVSGNLAQLREQAGSGIVDPSMDISDNIADAVELVDRARREGKKVADLVGQRDIFSGETVEPLTEAVLHLFFNGANFSQPAARVRIAERLDYYITQAGKAAPDGGLFGDETKAQPSDILALANDRDSPKQSSRQADLLDDTIERDGRDGAGIQSRSERAEQSPAETALQSAGRESAEQELGAESRPKKSIPEGDLPTVDASTADWGKLPASGKARMEILRGRVLAWYRTVQGTSVTSSDGRTVKFGLAGKGKTLRAGEDLLARAKAIPQIIQQGTLISSEPARQTDLKAVHRYAANVSVDGANPMPVLVTVREAHDGTFYYSLNRYVARDASAEADGLIRSIAPALEGDARDTFNLVPMAEDATTTGAAEVDTEALMQSLERAGIARKVRLKIVETLGGAAGDYGAYGAQMIRIATDTSQDDLFTLHHETIHALRDMDVFNTSEWSILAAKAKRDPGLMRSIRQRYGKLDAEAQTEEAVADMYARWQRGDYEAKGTIARLFKRLSDLLEAVRNAFAGRGFRSAEGVMADVDSGVVGRRRTGWDKHSTSFDRNTFDRNTPARQMIAWHGSPFDFDAFSTDFMGKGEGAQVYGWGLYFTERKGIAEHYRTVLTRMQYTVARWNGEKWSEVKDRFNLRTQRGAAWQNENWDALMGMDRVEVEGSVDGAIEFQEKLLKKYPTDVNRSTLAWLKEHRDEITVDKPGRVFQVKIPDDGEYLLWDKPLGEQPENIREAMDVVAKKVGMPPVPPTMRGRDAYEIISRKHAEMNGQKDADEGNGWTVANPTVHKNDRLASLALLDAGVKGIKYLDGMSRGQGEGSFNYVIFEGADAQILAKESRPEVKYSIPETQAVVALGGTDPTWKGEMGKAFAEWRRVLQDRHLPLLRVQREIEEQTGKALPNNLNPYLGEELMTGRIGAQLEKLTEDMVGPLFDAMADEKVSLEELETYLYARHAPERNARIAEINPGFAEGEGSGMTDIEARAIMNRIDKGGKTRAMKRLADRVDAIRDYAVDYRVKSGLMSEEQAAEWRATYEHYVPLRGFAEVEGDPAAADRISRSGGGINVRGRESKAAYGRRSKADSPLAYLILQAEEAITRGETNRVAQRFVELAKANPDDNFWKVNKAQYRRRMNPDTGLVEEYVVNQLLAEDADFTVVAKFNGKERRVTMNRNNPAARKLADSARRLTEHQMDWITIKLGTVNRFLSAVNTSWNPEFVITNALRDIQTATVNMQGLDVKGLTKGTLRDYRKALVAATKGAFRKGEGEWSTWYNEFNEQGGKVSFNKLEDVGEIKKRIETAMALAAAKHGGGTARLHVKRVALNFRDLVENLNSGVENAVRLAAYKNARELGMEKEQAASLAKNLTVNFNRRGAAGPALNALYLFFNASMQGSVRIIKAMRSRRVQKILAGVVAFGFAMELLNAMLAGDDEDGENFYDKISDHEKERNLIVMLPGGDGSYLKVPLPYGYNAFYAAGRTVAEIGRRGGDRWKDSLGNLLGTVVDSFNPVGGTNSLLNFISPTVVDPIVDLSQNRDFADNRILPDQDPYGPPVPDSQRYWGSVAPHWRTISEALSTATGGDGVTEGAIEVSPESLEYLSGVVVGAAGATLDRFATMLTNAIDPDAEVKINDVLFVRRLVGEKPSWYDRSQFYDRLGMVELHVDRTERYLEAQEIATAQTYASRHEEILRMEQAANEANRIMRRVRAGRREVASAFELGQIDAARRAAALEELDATEETVVLQFNTLWNTTMEASAN